MRWVQRRVDLNEYKREQAAPGIKVTSRAFGLGRRMPIAQQYAETDFAPNESRERKKIAPRWNRTNNPVIKSHLLCQLS